MASWRRKLARPLATVDGKTLGTLADARAYVLALQEGEQHYGAWQAAARLMLEAAEGGDVAAATEQIGLALFVHGRLKLDPQR